MVVHSATLTLTLTQMGVIFQIAIPLTTGMQVGCFQVLSPPTFPTAANILRGVRDLHANLVIAPASVIADWSGDGEAVETLRNLDAVVSFSCGDTNMHYQIFTDSPHLCRCSEAVH